MPYIEAAEAAGLSELQIVIRHALPNILPQLLVVGALEMGAVSLLTFNLLDNCVDGCLQLDIGHLA